MKISRSAQTCALGAAIFGAVVGGAYRRVEQAQRKMTGTKATVYRPNPKATRGLRRTVSAVPCAARWIWHDAAATAVARRHERTDGDSRASCGRAEPCCKI